MLTGRTPNRECIFSAEGGGQEPAWSCNDPSPLPPTTFTLAKAAKLAGMDTAHIGKWHLGNFFPMEDPYYPSSPSFAYSKWPVSHPGIAGFDFWHSTEASASVRLRARLRARQRLCLRLYGERMPLSVRFL